VGQQEAGAAALGEVESDSVQSRFAALETETDVERQLAELKAKKPMATPGEATALPAGYRISDYDAFESLVRCNRFERVLLLPRSDGVSFTFCN
jgi:hypothetical protein